MPIQFSPECPCCSMKPNIAMFVGVYCPYGTCNGPYKTVMKFRFPAQKITLYRLGNGIGTNFQPDFAEVGSTEIGGNLILNSYYPESMNLGLGPVLGPANSFLNETWINDDGTFKREELDAYLKENGQPEGLNGWPAAFLFSDDPKNTPSSWYKLVFDLDSKGSVYKIFQGLTTYSHYYKFVPTNFFKQKEPQDLAVTSNPLGDWWDNRINEPQDNSYMCCGNAIVNYRKELNLSVSWPGRDYHCNVVFGYNKCLWWPYRAPYESYEACRAANEPVAIGISEFSDSAPTSFNAPVHPNYLNGGQFLSGFGGWTSDYWVDVGGSHHEKWGYLDEKCNKEVLPGDCFNEWNGKYQAVGGVYCANSEVGVGGGFCDEKGQFISATAGAGAGLVTTYSNGNPLEVCRYYGIFVDQYWTVSCVDDDAYNERARWYAPYEIINNATISSDGCGIVDCFNGGASTMTWWGLPGLVLEGDEIAGSFTYETWYNCGTVTVTVS